MHELSIARSILDSLPALAELGPGESYAAIRLRLGEVSGVEPEALRFGLDALARDRGWPPLELRVEHLPLRRRCRDCDCEPDVGATTCPRCGGRRLALAGGDEIEIAAIEVEEAA